MLLVASVAWAQQQSPLDRLLSQFASLSAMECHFQEEKHIALLTTPIRSEGTLHYVRPRALVRRTTSPRSQIVLVEGDSLRMNDGGRIETIDLAAQPVVRSFVDTFGQLLSGDRSALDRTYRVELAQTDVAWTLTLTPKISPLDRFLSKIRFFGRGTSLERMVMDEVSGDSTTTTFRDVITNRALTEAERSRVFSLR
jgi:outer membrane lipoprotein-sorting protein